MNTDYEKIPAYQIAGPSTYHMTLISCNREENPFTPLERYTFCKYGFLLKAVFAAPGRYTSIPNRALLTHRPVDAPLPGGMSRIVVALANNKVCLKHLIDGGMLPFREFGPGPGPIPRPAPVTMAVRVLIGPES